MDKICIFTCTLKRHLHGNNDSYITCTMRKMIYHEICLRPPKHGLHSTYFEAVGIFHESENFEHGTVILRLLLIQNPYPMVKKCAL